MTTRRLQQLVTRLHARTVAQELDWERTPRDEVYQCSFSSYVVQLRVRQSQYEDDALDYIVEIRDEAGRLVESFDDWTLSREGMDSAYQMMGATYNAARRAALGTDAALDALIAELGGD